MADNNPNIFIAEKDARNLGGHYSYGKCSTCGELYKASPFHLRQPSRNFCSRNCADIGRRVLMPLRFWRYVNKTTTCWLWVGAFGRGGYGKFTDDSKRTRGAHRIAWELTNGLIPTGLFVCHNCDNPQCVRPAHLFLGTAADNMRDKVEKGRQAKGPNVGPKNPTKGEAHHKSKLNAEKVREIRRLYSEGLLSEDAIAVQYGVHQTTINCILRWKTWRHVC